jgi:hypothetical protein
MDEAFRLVLLLGHVVARDLDLLAEGLLQLHIFAFLRRLQLLLLDNLRQTLHLLLKFLPTDPL